MFSPLLVNNFHIFYQKFEYFSLVTITFFKTISFLLILTTTNMQTKTLEGTNTSSQLACQIFFVKKEQKNQNSIIYKK